MTVTFKKIMVGVDESEDALKAFAYALQRAKEEDAELIIVSILEYDKINIYEALDKRYWEKELVLLKERIEKYKTEALESGVKNVKVLVDEGNPGELIVSKLLPFVQPDLLIIGAKSKKNIAKHFGSQAAYIVKHSDVSTMIVR